MKSLLPSPRYRYTTILILIVVCTVALIKSASSFAQEDRQLADRTKIQESGPAQGSDKGRAGSTQQEKKTDVLERLISSDPGTKTPGDSGILIPSQVDAGANLLLPVISATMVDALVVDVDGDGRFDPGDTIEYTVNISNTGPDPATGVKFADIIDANTTLVGLSINSSPIAFDDTVYTATGNVRIAIPDGATDLIANDIDPDTQNNTNLTAVVETKKSANCAACATNNVSISANGSFTYDPPPGFTGSDTFTYTVRDTGVDLIPNNADDATGVGTATFTVSGMIWFINSAAGVNGDGRLTSPFNCLRGPACFDTTTIGGAADDPGDNIFLYNGTYTGGLTLLANQRLIGQGTSSPLTGVGSITGITPPAGSDAVPATNGNPDNVTITTAAAATNSVTLGSGNLLRGFGIGNTTGGADILGNAFGTLILGNSTSLDLKLFGTGQALSLTNGTLSDTSGINGVISTSSAGTGITLNQVGVSSAISVPFNGVQITGSAAQGMFVTLCTGSFSFGNTTIGSGTASSGGTDAISLQNNSAGTRSFGAVTIQNNTLTGFLHSVGGGTTTVSGTLTITNPGTRGIDIQDSTTLMSFQDANVTLSGGTGVFLDDNTGAVTFADLDINPDAGQRGLHATDQSTGAITTTSGTITAATNTAVEIFGTSAAVTTPVAMVLTTVSSSGSAAPNGIILRNTSGTGFSIVGTGSAGSGGTIANKTGADASATQGTGIYLNNVQNVSFARMQLNDFQNFGIQGSSVNNFTLTNSVINGTNGTSSVTPNEEGSIRFGDTTNNGLTGSASITNCTIAGGASEALRVRNSSGVLNRLTVSGSTISNIRNPSVNAFLFEIFAGTGNLTVQDSFFTAGQGNLIQTAAHNSATTDVVIRQNKFSNNHPNISNGGGGVIVSGGDTGAHTPTVTYDVSCNRFQGARGPALTIFKGNSSGGTYTGTVSGNVIGVSGVVGSGSQDASGMFITALGKGTHTTAVLNNQIFRTDETGIAFRANDSGGAGGATLNATVFGNVYAQPDSFQFAGLYVDLGAAAGDTNIVNIVVGSLSNAAQKNDFSPGDPANFSDVSLNRNIATTTLNLFRNGSVAGTVTGVIQDDNLNPGTTTVSTTGTINLVAGVPTAPPAVGACTLPAPRFIEGSPNDNEVGAIDINGERQNMADLPGMELVNQIPHPSFEQFRSLPPVVAGASRLPAGDQSVISNEQATGNRLLDISRTAWQLRPEQFNNHASLSGTKRLVLEAQRKTSADANTQELTAQEGNSPQEGKKPSKADSLTVKQDKDESGDSGETVNVGGAGGFTLPSGKSTVIKFRVTIDTGVLPAFTQVMTQGTVTSNIAPVQTDDTALGGANDATITPIDHTTVAIISSANPSVYGQPVTFTATMTGVPARASDPPGSVQFKRNGVDFGGPIPVVVGTVGDNVSTAQSVAISAPDLSVGNHTITAVYSGGGVNPNAYNTNLGTLATGQTVNKANSASAIITDTPDPSLTGQSVNVTFTVSAVAPGAGTPTGDVTVSDGVDQCTATAAVGNCSLTLTTAGVRNLTATYVGDGNFNASPASPAATHTVTATATWVGGTSTDWDTDANWGTGRKPNLPSHSANIPAAGVTNEPTISVADVLLTDLTVATGRTLTLNLGRILTATGNTILSGNLAGGGTSNFNNLTINNAAGVAIGGNANVSGVLTLTSGNTTVTGTLAVGGAGSITRTAGHIIGNLRKTFAAPGAFTFHVGTANGYSPVGVNVTAGTGDLTIKATQGTVPPLNPATTLQRYWTLTETGSLTANLTFNYNDPLDIMGNEAVYRIIRVEGGVPVSIPNNCPTGPCVNPATNSAIINGVTNFSEWTIGEQFAPTAITADVSGRVTYANDRPMRGVIVSLLNTNTSEVVLTRTNAKGQYRFSEVATGVDYVITPFKEGYEFNPPNQFISHTGVRENLDFGSAVSKPGPAGDDGTQGGKAKHGSNPIPADFVPPAEP